ncbi:MAG: tRNA pseudouridine(13) synthase TruD [Desulfuromonadales bacterium]
MLHPYLTNHLPGIGGTIKESPDDFVVEEILSYLPCGSGEHCFLTVEKRGITTLEAIRRIAVALKIPERNIGYAGMKDAVGVTRQTISVQSIAPEKVMGFELEGVRILSSCRHTNKLKLGHLKGNRFRIAIRDLSDGSETVISSVLDILRKRGVPNYFGLQRYGAQGNSHLIGAAMLQRDWKGVVDALIGQPAQVKNKDWSAAIDAYRRGDVNRALQLFPRHCRVEREVLQRLASRTGEYEKAGYAINPSLKKLYLSAVQSCLFDQVVDRRIEHIDELMTGDLACKHVNGACFLVENAETEMERAGSFEISASGPIFGFRMKQPLGIPLEMESEILNSVQIGLNDFDLPGGLRMEGERRPLRVPLICPSFRLQGNCLRLEFALPKGSYATSVLREIMKSS